MIVRGRHFGFDAPESEAGVGTLFYAADDSRIEEARLTGDVPPIDGPPRPTVLIMPGINVAPDGYRWLAVRLVEAGCCAVTYSTIGGLGPAGVGITPGLDMAALAPDVIGTRPSASAVNPLLAAIANVGSDVCDLAAVSLVGHSAGGTVALHNTNPEWIPGLRSVAVYGAHTMTARALGHGEAAVVAVPSAVPVLLVAGGSDAVIAASRDRYRTDDGEHDPVRRTFEEAINRNEGDSYLVELTDGNHFTMCDPIDETTGRAFLEPDLRGHDAAARDLLADIICTFVSGRSLDAFVDRGGVQNLSRR